MTEYDLLLRPFAALLAGGLIGLERTYHGRAAGVRTYALVSLGAALLVSVAVYGFVSDVRGQGDATRVIQGIVTGIGFLGAGVIVKEGFTVRGLTTAASIWVVSAIGIVLGAGFFGAGAAATILTFVSLALLRRVEDRIQPQRFAHCHVAFRRDRILDEAFLRQLAERHGFAITEMTYRLDSKAELFEYRFVVWSTNENASRALQESLRSQAEVVDFRISPSRD